MLLYVHNKTCQRDNMPKLDADDEQEKIDAMVKQYLDDGGEVTTFEKYARSENIEYTGGWGKKRKKTIDPDNGANG